MSGSIIFYTTSEYYYRTFPMEAEGYTESTLILRGCPIVISRLDITWLDTDIRIHWCILDMAAVQLDPWSAWGEWTPDCSFESTMGCYKKRQRYCMVEDYALCGSKADQYGIEEEFFKCPNAQCGSKNDLTVR